MRVAIVIPGQGAHEPGGDYLITERCRAVVAEAARLAETLAPEAVVFTGFSPRGDRSEAEQMRDIWAGPDVELVIEPTARITAENASRTLPLLLDRGIDRAVVVAAWSHAFRSRFFFSRVYGRSGIPTSVHVVRSRLTPRVIAWELVALPLAPSQLRAARRDVQRAAREPEVRGSRGPGTPG